MCRSRWRGKVLFLAILAATAVMPASAHARPRGVLPGIFGAVTSPLRAIIGGPRSLRARGARHHPRHHRKAVAARSVPRATAAAVDLPATEAAWVGQLYWSSAYDDIVDFAVWPSGNNNRLWTHGYRDIFDGIFAAESAYGEESGRQTSTIPTGNVAERDTTGTVGLTDRCGSRKASSAPEQEAETAIRRIERTVQPTEDQRLALEALRDALNTANETIRNACPAADTPPAPLARLNTMMVRLIAMHRAVLIIRTPFEKFYNSLTVEQKTRMNGAGSQYACGEHGAAVPAWPSRQIENALRPTNEQWQLLSALRITSSQFAEVLAAICPKQNLPTPLVRLDATAQWLNAMLYAAMTINRPLAGFYLSLDDEQKARFQFLGRQDSTAVIR